MKKTALLLIGLLLLPLISHGETHLLSIRASSHPDSLRIVLEGNESLINNARVYQKGQSILVNFPDEGFKVKAEEGLVAYTIDDKNTIIFRPGNFRGLKVFTLKQPARLVIDVYLKKSEVPTSPRSVQKDAGKVTARETIKGKSGFEVPGRSGQDESKKSNSRVPGRIVIDPGHGGYEFGIVKDEYIEKHIALDIGKKIAALVKGSSSAGYITRGSDIVLTQQQRAEFVNSKDVDIFISLHIGRHNNLVIYYPVLTEHAPEAVKPYLYNKGQEKYMQKTFTLLNAMKDTIISDFGEGMVTIKPLPYSILTRIEAAALIIELPSFDDAVYDEELKTRWANVLSSGLYRYEEIKSE